MATKNTGALFHAGCHGRLRIVRGRLRCSTCRRVIQSPEEILHERVDREAIQITALRFADVVANSPEALSLEN